jgi:predicted metal-dependent phosphoesterase TrpH
MLKVELHAHTAQDRADRVTHSTRELVEHAMGLGYHALAVTLHDTQHDTTRDAAWARERGFVLLPGIERTVQGKHVLLINFPPQATAAVRRFEDIPRVKAAHPRGLVVVPHAFYPIGSAMGTRLDAHGAWVDAVEINAMYTRYVNFNGRAIEWARAHHKPLVGNTDLHLLAQMGTTYTLVDAPRDPDAICEAIRQGRTEVRTAPLPALKAAWLFPQMLLGGLLPPASLEE